MGKLHSGNKSGFNGVSLVKNIPRHGKAYFRFTTVFTNTEMNHQKSISIPLHGWLSALTKAVECRRDNELRYRKKTDIPNLKDIDMQQKLDECIANYIDKYPELEDLEKWEER